MNSIASIAGTGMRVAMLSMNAAAHNIANQQTDGFHREVVSQQSLPQGGVTAVVAQSPQEGVSLATELVQQMAALYAFKANMLTVQTEQEMLGTLLDTRA
jgi:flagellar hook-associated protein FlgK